MGSGNTGQGRCRPDERRRPRRRQLAELRTNVQRAALQPADKDNAGQCEAARPCVVCGPRYQSRTGGDAAGHRRRPLHVDRMEHGQGLRCGDRQAPLVIRPRSAARARRRGLLRRGQSRNRGLEGQDLRRHVRREVSRTRRGDGQAGVERRDRRSKQVLYHHSGATRHQGARRNRHERR